MQDFAKRAERHKHSEMRQHRRGSLPVSLIITVLIAAGGLAGFLAYLAQIPEQNTNYTATPKTRPPVAAKVETRAAQQPTSAKPKFGFYEMLRNSEVIAPEVEEYSSDRPKKAGAPSSYLLQAGSFRRYADADRLRARLILEGLDVKVQRVSSSGTPWHRVLVGPFTSRSELNRAQDILAAANTESMLITLKQ